MTAAPDPALRERRVAPFEAAMVDQLPDSLPPTTDVLVAWIPIIFIRRTAFTIFVIVLSHLIGRALRSYRLERRPTETDPEALQRRAASMRRNADRDRELGMPASGDAWDALADSYADQARILREELHHPPQCLTVR